MCIVHQYSMCKNNNNKETVHTKHYTAASTRSVHLRTAAAAPIHTNYVQQAGSVRTRTLACTKINTTKSWPNAAHLTIDPSYGQSYACTYFRVESCSFSSFTSPTNKIRNKKPHATYDRKTSLFLFFLRSFCKRPAKTSDLKCTTPLLRPCILSLVVYVPVFLSVSSARTNFIKCNKRTNKVI